MNHQKTGIIDMHSHIIPDTDDGSRTLEETTGMLKCAYAQGVRAVIATPHYIHRHNRKNADQILEALEQVRTYAKEISPDFKIYSGEELLYYEGILDALDSKRALTLGFTRYVLIEFSTSAGYRELFQAVRGLTRERYIPVLAHVERYPCLRKTGCLDELCQMGAYMQMNFSSLSGFTHPLDKSWCRKMLCGEKIHFLGTDMHRLDYRPPEIAKAVDWICKTVGLEYLEQLTYIHPKKLLAGEFIEP